MIPRPIEFYKAPDESTFCDYHKQPSHDTKSCQAQRYQINRMISEGKLEHFKGSKKVKTYADQGQQDYLADEVTQEPNNERYDPKHFNTLFSITVGYRPQCVMFVNAQRQMLATAKSLAIEEDN